jgi:hypothetical protein
MCMYIMYVLYLVLTKTFLLLGKVEKAVGSFCTYKC